MSPAPGSHASRTAHRLRAPAGAGRGRRAELPRHAPARGAPQQRAGSGRQRRPAPRGTARARRVPAAAAARHSGACAGGGACAAAAAEAAHAARAGAGSAGARNLLPDQPVQPCRPCRACSRALRARRAGWPRRVTSRWTAATCPARPGGLHLPRAGRRWRRRALAGAVPHRAAAPAALQIALRPRARQARARRQPGAARQAL